MTDAAVSTKRCPYCAEEIRVEAIKCRYCGSRLDTTSSTRSWQRSRARRRIAGVCAGLAEEFDISVTLVRLAFLLATAVGGSGLIVYVALWVLMPLAPLEDDLERTEMVRPGDRDQDLRPPDRH